MRHEMSASIDRPAMTPGGQARSLYPQETDITDTDSDAMTNLYLLNLIENRKKRNAKGEKIY